MNSNYTKWLRSLGVTALVLLFAVIVQGQVSGTVLGSEDQSGLIGATVTIKNSTTGVTTDVDGSFNIDASVGDILVFEYLGYETIEMELSSLEPLLVTLRETSELLSEVVVVGYSSKTKKELSASLTTISSDDLQTVVSSNVETMLQGQVPGLTVSSSTGAPGAAADIRIRGITSINADKPPLFVVDGMIGGSFVPNDVESLTVLKDAAAIGLFGSAGAAGVIIVTTKQGTSEVPTIEFSSTVGVKEAVTGNFSMMDASTLYEAQRQMWGAQNSFSFLSNRPNELLDRNFDWMDAGFGRGLLQNYNLAIRGKTEKVAYSLSGDYFTEEGTFINTDFQRANLRGNLKFQISDKLSFQTDVNAQTSRNNFNYFSWFEDVFWNMPWDNPYAADGSVLGPTYVTDPSNEWYGQFKRSFLYSTQFNELSYSDNSLVWSNQFKYNINDWLTLESRARLSNYNGSTKEYYAPNTDEGLAVNGIVNVSDSKSWGVAATTFLRASKSFGDHELSGFIAYEGGYSEESTLGLNGQNLASQTIQVPAGASVFDGSGADITFKGYSYISELGYSYANKYFATGYFRRDGSSLFPENKRFGNFGGGSIGWLISEEPFMANSKNIDLLKLRLSYGVTGNSNVPPFAHIAGINITRQYNNAPGGEPSSPGNPFLGWESTQMANAGLDINMFKNSLVLSVDVYQKTVKGMLLRNPLPFSSGFQSRTENIGDMKNVGIEAAISYSKTFGKIGLRSSLNFAFNKNEITKITDILDEQTVTAGAIQQINVVGSEAFQWYMPKWLGVNPADGTPLWEVINYDDAGNETSRSSTGVYGEATFQPMGSAIPEITGGFNNTISYGNLGLSFLFTFQTGNDIYHYTREFVDSDGASVGINLMNLHDGWNRWENPGDIATHPVLNRGGTNGANNTSSRYIEKGDYIRLRNVTLSYSLPTSWLSKLNIGSANLSLSADNMFTFTDFSGMDPDVGLNVEAFSLPGLSYLKYPISKQVSLGLRVQF